MKKTCTSCSSSRCFGSWFLRTLLVIGGLNWGLVGIGMFVDKNLNVVNMIFGSVMWLEAVIYLLVALAALSSVCGGCRCSKCKNGKMAACCASCKDADCTHAKCCTTEETKNSGEIHG